MAKGLKLELLRFESGGSKPADGTEKDWPTYPASHHMVHQRAPDSVVQSVIESLYRLKNH